MEKSQRVFIFYSLIGVVCASVKKLPLYHHLGELVGKRNYKFILSVPLPNIINGGTHASNQLEL